VFPGVVGIAQPANPPAMVITAILGWSFCLASSVGGLRGDLGDLGDLCHALFSCAALSLNFLRWPLLINSSIFEMV
jgi:hypothetical protein